MGFITAGKCTSLIASCKSDLVLSTWWVTFGSPAASQQFLVAGFERASATDELGEQGRFSPSATFSKTLATR
jgi:hypothetical protein